MRLFCRERNDGDFGAQPYFLLGPGRYVTHTGSRPMAITWKLDHRRPTSSRRPRCSPDE